jgi:hypothetical protein
VLAAAPTRILSRAMRAFLAVQPNRSRLRGAPTEHADGATRPPKDHQPHLAGARGRSTATKARSLPRPDRILRRPLPVHESRTCEIPRFGVARSPGMSGGEQEVVMGAGEGEGEAGAAYPQYDDSDSEDEVFRPRGTRARFLCCCVFPWPSVESRR